ncbi:hypothetical protein [Nocardia sp. NPDC046763]|uniref:hypothetical protein n=1 Tax=Nocardia sp. NPDC046763 TaxID=3155256 RepID=UPI0033F976D4
MKSGQNVTTGTFPGRPDAGADEVLALLTLPMLGGVVAVCDGVYRTGAEPSVVLARLRSLADAMREVEYDEEPDDRY